MECWKRLAFAVSIAGADDYRQRMLEHNRAIDERIAALKMAADKAPSGYTCKVCSGPIPMKIIERRKRNGGIGYLGIKYTFDSCTAPKCVQQARNCIKTGRSVQPRLYERAERAGKCACLHTKGKHFGGEICTLCECAMFHVPYARDGKKNDALQPHYARMGLRVSLDAPLDGTDGLTLYDGLAASAESDPQQRMDAEFIDPMLVKRAVLQKYLNRDGLYKTQAGRNLKIFQRYEAGDDMNEIAKDFGITRARILMIVYAVEAWLLQACYKLHLDPREMGMMVA